MGGGVWMVLPVFFIALAATSVTVVTTDQDEAVYFSNSEDIEVVVSENGSRVVFASASTVVLETMDCNPNPSDRRIYWISGMKDNKSGAIKRGFPDSNGSMETVSTVLQRDIYNPKGIAVDWSTNNIYFSHTLSDGEESGRIEVVSSDGQNRRVLFYGFVSNYIAPSTGALAVNVLTGYLYFIDSITISRCYLDGSHREMMIEGSPIDQYDGLTIDEETNILYWTVRVVQTTQVTPLSYAYYVRSLSISEFEARGMQPVSDLVRTRTVHLVHDVFVYNQSMYLTVPSGPGSSGGTPGAIMFIDILGVDWSASEEVELTGRFLFKEDSFDPRGVCTFKNMSGISSPCSDGSLCEPSAFCFTIPDGQGGTTGSCGCSTGLTLNRENNMTCASVPEEFLLFTRLYYTTSLNPQISRSEIRMVPLEGENQRSFVDILLPFDLYRKQSVHVAYDILYHKVYWTEWSPPCIKRANFNGTQVEVFINSSIYNPEGLAIDPYAGNLYWADSRLNIISVTSLTNSSYRKTLFEGVIHPQGLALDVIRGFLYWTDLHIRGPVVERALLNGQERMQISAETTRSPTNVAVDSETGDVYWIKYNKHSSSSKIVRYSQQMEVPVNLGDHTLAMAFDLAVLRDYLYWTDRDSSNDHGIARVAKTGGDSVQLIDKLSGSHGLVAINNTRAATSSDVSTRCRANTCSQLCFQSHNSSTSFQCACNDHFMLTDSTRCTDSEPRFYIALGSYLREFTYMPEDGRFDPNGIDIFLGNGTLKAMDADLLENMVYWIDGTDKTIKRRSLNASVDGGYELVVMCCLSQPEDLAVDWFGRNIYWTDSARRVIEVATLSGSGRMILLEVNPSLGPPGNIVLDPIRGYVYWTSRTTPHIYRIKMDGSESVPSLFAEYRNYNSSITALAIGFDKLGGNLYWAVDDSGAGEYQVFSKLLLNGGDPFEISSAFFPITDLREAKDHVYAAIGGERSSIQDLSSHNNKLYETEPPNHLSQFLLLHHTIQPGKHVCQVSSQCNGDSFCLVSDELSRQCRCDARRIRKMKGPESDDLFDCTLPHTFLLLATDSLIHYLPLPDNGNDTSVRRLPFTPEGKIADMAYDPVNRSVMWITANSNHLTSVALNSSAEWIIPLSVEPLQTFSMAYDWRGGHVFLTEKDSFEIKMAVVNGDGRGVILQPSLYGGEGSLLNKPGELLMNSKDGILYYTILNGLSNESRSLRELSLRDIGQSKELPLSGSQIGKLTFDPESRVFYWIRYRPNHEEGDVIEKYSIVDDTTVEIATRASQVEALGVLTASVYWYNRTDGYLYRHSNVVNATRYLKWDLPDTTKVVRIIGYNSSSLLFSNLPCLDAQRPCSHLCVDTSATPTCYCPLDTTSDDNNVICRQNKCSAVTFSCNTEFGSCIPGTYFCDGIPHCSNGVDEKNCSCNTELEQGCFTNRDQCYTFSQRCDGVNQCGDGKDEQDCCSGERFGCFVDRAPNPPYFDCLDLLSKCDGEEDCIDGSDEKNCTMTTDSSTLIISPDPPSDRVTATVVITLLIISVITVVVVVVIVISVVRLMWKRRAEARSRHSISYLRQTPHDSNSDYSNSEVSHNTNTTQINGSAISHCANSKPMDLTNPMNLLNPPPSPISTIPPRHSLALSEEDDDISRLSQSFSEYAPPPPPCPSINYDNVSSMSISVSQSRYPATINNGGPTHPSTQHYHQYQHYHHPSQVGGVARQSGRNLNPLLSRSTAAQQQNHYVTCNGGIPYQERGRNGAVQCHQSNHLSYNLSSMHHRGRGPYPDISEQDTLAQLETESTMSAAMDNVEGYPYDASMPHPPPPGRPPSPVTMYSEYHGQPPLSPQSSRRSPQSSRRSSSTASFSSQD